MGSLDKRGAHGTNLQHREWAAMSRRSPGVTAGPEQTIGLIAGNGPLPILFAREALARGFTLVAVGHQGETSESLEGLVTSMDWVRVGELDALIRILRSHGVTQAVMLGGIDKGRAIKGLSLDERASKLLRDMASRGDDRLLSALARELEREGIEVRGFKEFVPSWIAPLGCVNARRPTARELLDLRLGIKVLAHLGPMDIGQTVVVKEGVVLAVEAVEGTDRTISRGGQLGGPGGVVIKGSKPTQDLRFDLPTVGPETVKTMSSVGATLLAVEAGCTVMVERDEMVSAADRRGISILGWSREVVYG